MTEHGFGILTVIGKDTDSHTCPDVADVIINLDWLIEQVNGLAGHFFRAFKRIRTLQQDNKLITSEPAD